MDAEKLRKRIATAIQQRELYIAKANMEAARFLGQIQAMEGMLGEMQAAEAEAEARIENVVIDRWSIADDEQIDLLKAGRNPNLKWEYGENALAEADETQKPDD